MDQVEKARRRVELDHKNCRALESKLLMYRTNVRPFLDYCSVVCFDARQCDRIQIENVQGTSVKRLLGYFP